MHVCVFLSQSASVEHSRTVQNGESAWPTEGSYRPPGVPFPLFSRCFSAVSTTIKRQEEPRGIVSVYVTPRAMGAKVVQEVLVGNLRLYRRTDLAQACYRRWKWRPGAG